MQIVRCNKFVQFLSCSVVLTPNENGLFVKFYLLTPYSLSKYVGLIGLVIGADDSSPNSMSLMDSVPKKQDNLLTPLKLWGQKRVISRNVSSIDTHQN
jgi:hypothetical protein